MKPAIALFCNRAKYAREGRSGALITYCRNLWSPVKHCPGRVKQGVARPYEIEFQEDDHPPTSAPPGLYSHSRPVDAVMLACVVVVVVVVEGEFLGGTDFELGATFGVAVVATVLGMFVAGMLVMLARGAGDGLFYSCIRDCMSINGPYAAGGGPATPALNGAAHALPPPAQLPQAAAAPQITVPPPNSGVPVVAPPTPATVTAVS